jgi:hypothetical protein
MFIIINFNITKLIYNFGRFMQYRLIVLIKKHAIRHEVNNSFKSFNIDIITKTARPEQVYRLQRFLWFNINKLKHYMMIANLEKGGK